jgi:hypothetical protein
VVKVRGNFFPTQPNKAQKGEIVSSDDRKFRDHEGYKAKIVIENSSHHDGSIYRDMDTWWKKEYCIADRNESKWSISLFSLVWEMEDSSGWKRIEGDFEKF